MSAQNRTDDKEISISASLESSTIDIRDGRGCDATTWLQNLRERYQYAFDEVENRRSEINRSLDAAIEESERIGYVSAEESRQRIQALFTKWQSESDQLDRDK